MLSRFSYSSGPGHVLSLARELNRQKIRTAVVMTDCPAPARKLIRAYCRKNPPFIAENNAAEIEKIVRHYRVDLLHIHEPSLLPLAVKLARQDHLPYGITVHEGPLAAAHLSGLEQAAFVVTVNPAILKPLAGLSHPAVFIPEGIEMAEYRPAKKDGFTITFIGETGGYTRDGYLALLKAAGLADMPVELVCREQLPQVNGRFHGWLPGCAKVLAGSQVVVGRRRALLEGLACGNAALLMGRSYHGLVERGIAKATPFPDLSGGGAEEPCYRNIFYDLSRLWKDRGYLSELQRWGRTFVRENCDLRLIAERTARLYRRG